MDVHKNARPTVFCRGQLIDRVLKSHVRAQVAAQLGISVQTVNKWFRRFQSEGLRGLADRSPRPRRSPGATVRELELAVVALRQQCLTLLNIAQQLMVSRATVARICARARLHRLSGHEPPPPVVSTRPAAAHP